MTTTHYKHLKAELPTKVSHLGEAGGLRDGKPIGYYKTKADAVDALPPGNDWVAGNPS